ncbi:hypothetical protein ES703_99493 [subsurface metagenome]
MDVINALTDELNFPLQTGENIEVQYTDSGRLQLIFKAPVMEKYHKSEEEGAYFEFNQGIEVYFYDEKEKLESLIKAGYAQYFEKKSLWKATDSVVARNVQTDEQLNSEEIYWDQENKRIYSHVFTKITNDEGVYFGEKGFESDQNLENYKLFGSRGSVDVKDEELP